MLTIIVLMSTVMLVVGQAFVTITSITRDSSHAQVMAVRLDSIVGKLRADAWHAASFETPDEATAVLLLPGDRRITWHTDANGTITRRVEVAQVEAESEAMTWEGLNLSLHFSHTEDALIVRSASGTLAPGTPGSSGIANNTSDIILVSQLRLAQRGRP